MGNPNVPCSVEHKIRYVAEINVNPNFLLWNILKNVGKQTFGVPIDFHYIKKNKINQWKSMGTPKVCLTTFFKIFHRRKFVFSLTSIILTKKKIEINVNC